MLTSTGSDLLPKKVCGQPGFCCAGQSLVEPVEHFNFSSKRESAFSADTFKVSVHPWAQSHTFTSMGTLKIL